MTSSDSSHASCLDIALPGYTLREQLGAGGYGEVWSATAPGDLCKAVKFVFGHYSDKRATRELRALEKIKGVRHPFLLSLERIEVLDDRLVIITELAEASLKDRFDHCLTEGLPGIPREELLGYLRDAADALDYLSREHSLQHLDVKPENLLLLAGHVKVADFGLVKDVANSQASLVGGLTPLYAAPEVFQGRPSQHSDQYSLAVLYQEMLTGVAPFAGQTAAELTMQHLKDDPDLSPLPAADRYSLARAMAKDVKRRFGSCSEFIGALTAGGSQWHTQSQDAPAAATDEPTAALNKSVAPARRTPGPVTEVFDEVIGSEHPRARPSILLEPAAKRTTETCLLPPPEFGDESFAASPTLVIGVGGVGGNVLCQLRRQMTARFGDHRNVPALATLLLDCDSKAIVAATRSGRPGALRIDETLSLSLRRPQDYRDRSDGLQQWLSRRWLYNIPKSLNTEGLRPLGRLALLDHLMQTLQRVRLALVAASSDASLAQASEATGIEYRSDALRVYVVAAASGGLGGGAAIDLGYALRTVLAKLDFAASASIGIFTHSLGSDQRSSELARVNAYSWLTEYVHAAQPDFAYPGDPCGSLPAFPAGVKPYDHSYLVQLEDGLDPEEFRDAAAEVADYLFLDAFTPAQQFFDASREAALDNPTPSSMRSFGVRPIATAPPAEVAAAASKIVQRIVRSWHGEKIERPAVVEEPPGRRGVKAAAEPPPELPWVHPAASRIIAQLQLDLPALTGAARRVLEDRLQCNVERYYLRTLASIREQEQSLTTSTALKAADDLFAAGASLGANETTHLLDHPLEQLLDPLTQEIGGELRRQILSMLDDPEARLSGAQAAFDGVRTHLLQMQRTAAEASLQTGLEVRQAAEQLHADCGPDSLDDPTPEQMNGLLKYVKGRMDQAALYAAGSVIAGLSAAHKEVGDQLRQFSRHLDLASRSAKAARDDAAAQRAGSAEAGSAGAAIDSLIKHRLDDLANEADRTTHKNFTEQNGGLFDMLVVNGRLRGALLSALLQEAIAAVHRGLGHLNLTEGLLDASDERAASLSDGAVAADPGLLSYGGAVQRLAVVSQDDLLPEQADLLRQRLGGTGVVTAQHVDFFFCAEAQQIPVSDWALDAIEARRDYAEFAKRVHTRKDIAWEPLHADSTPPVAAPVDWTSASPPVTQTI